MTLTIRHQSSILIEDVIECLTPEANKVTDRHRDQFSAVIHNANITTSSVNIIGISIA
ncbi:MAG: hypothetical protein J6Q60_05690 [Bacteroidaceae bacterium]|nr:hypothetical protein [Bacteroidaceae bacterium]